MSAISSVAALREVAYSVGMSLGTGLLEFDPLIQSIHQADGVELGLDTLEEGAKERRGCDDCLVSYCLSGETLDSSLNSIMEASEIRVGGICDSRVSRINLDMVCRVSSIRFPYGVAHLVRVDPSGLRSHQTS